MKKSGNEFVNTANSRKGTKYEGVIKQINQNKICPFCPEHLLSIHKNPILTEGDRWVVTDNMYPYTSIAHHVLFIHKEHVEHINELSSEAWQELHLLFAEQCKKRGIQGGSLLLRFGDTNFTGASVSHLHAHLIQSDPKHPDYNQEKRWIGVIARVG